MGKGRM